MMRKSGERRASKRGAQARRHLVVADQRLAGHRTALLRRHLILQMDPCHPGTLEGLHRLENVGGPPVAGIGVGDDRNGDRARHLARMPHHVVHRNEADVRLAVARRHRIAGHVDRLESGPLDEHRPKRVVRPWNRNRLAARKEIPRSGTRRPTVYSRVHACSYFGNDAASAFTVAGSTAFAAFTN